MTDIVEKLRSQIGDDVMKIYSHEALFIGAADEITRLRTENAQRCPYGRDNKGDPTWQHTEQDLCPVCGKDAENSTGACVDSPSHPAWKEIARLRARLAVADGELAALDRSHTDLARKLATVGAENERLRGAEWLTDSFMNTMFWFVRKNYGDGFPVDEEGRIIGWNEWLRNGVMKAIDARAALSTEGEG